MASLYNNRYDFLQFERHKVFVSYHHANDQWDRERFEGLFSNYFDIIIARSVQIGDIDPYLSIDTVRQKVRDEYLRDSTVTVVLIGKETWKRKHVDWEISSSIRQTKLSSRSGLLGIILPDHPDFIREKYNPYIIPPRLYYNVVCKYANIYDWSNNPATIASWIQLAFDNRFKTNPDNSYPSFVNNKFGERWY